MADMLRAPTANELDPASESNKEKIERVKVSYEDRNAKFYLKSKKFTQQYSHLYNKRLLQLRESVSQTANKLYGEGYEFAEKVIDLKEGQKCYIVGTLYKTMKLKPSVLDQFKELAQTTNAVERLDDYTDDDDSLVLEDETGRVPLSADSIDLLPVRAMSTGLVIAVAGVVNSAGFLHVDHWCPPGPAPCLSPNFTPPNNKNDNIPNSDGDVHVLLVSGLEVGGTHDAIATSLLVDYVTGHIGGDEDTKMASRIARVIIAGNSRTPVPSHLLTTHKLTKETQAKIHGPMNDLDTTLSVLASSVPVDLLPGDYDPSGHWLPQQPLPACVLPLSSNFSTLNRVTNPYDANVHGINIIGSSGQPINDLRRYSKLNVQNKKHNDEQDDNKMDDEDEKTNNNDDVEVVSSEVECIDWLEEMIKWRHMAPTAPDTLDIYPMLLIDPFVLETTPNIFFAGNQAGYAAKKVNVSSLLPSSSSSSSSSSLSQSSDINDEAETLLISVPCFASTGVAVLVNLNSLECAPISFKGLPSEDDDSDKMN